MDGPAAHGRRPAQSDGSVGGEDAGLFVDAGVADAGIREGRLALDPGHLVVSGAGLWIVEYTLDGREVAKIEVPRVPGDLSDHPRDMVHRDGRLFVYNGTFEPDLSIFDNATGAWDSRTLPGWSTVFNNSYGGIALQGNRVFVTDMETRRGGEPTGIVVFDLADGSATRHLPGNEHVDLTLGLDGLLYAVRDHHGAVDVIDPASVEVVETMDLGHLSSSRAVAVGRAGGLYMASLDGYVQRFDARRRRQGSIVLGAPLLDIDLRSDGVLAAVSSEGDVYVFHASEFDRPVPSIAHFETTSSTYFVAFTE